MASSRIRFVLGSRSPRRKDLLELLIPASLITVHPPERSEELSFDGLSDDGAIQDQLLDVARTKCNDVCAAYGAGGVPADTIVVTADTIVVARDASGTPIVLGKPPDDGTFEDVVRSWFIDHLAGKPHTVSTGMSVVLPDGRVEEKIVTTEVTFRADVDRLLDWYIATGESRGKAGGYALQGAGSVFVDSVKGSLSNVIGLPLEELQRILFDAGIDCGIVAANG